MSWILSKKYRFIFVHIPKTGGTSIADPDYSQGGRGALIDCLGKDDIMQQGHVRAAGLRDRIGEDWNHFFKFTFVRNPWDRLVSLYHYFLQDAEKRASDLGRRIAQCLDFASFCRQLDELNLDPHFDQQVSYMIDYEGDLIIDYIARFEALEAEYRKICVHLGIPARELPHYRRSEHCDYRSYYDDECREIVLKKYRDDIKLLQYEF